MNPWNQMPRTMALAYLLVYLAWIANDWLVQPLRDWWAARRLRRCRRPLS